ncbi:hypothetical protein ACP275_11G040600 [Erythranthe tilingii]
MTQNQETDSFVPVIPRLDRLDRVLKLLEEEKHSLLSSRRDFCCKTLSSALQEVQHKGTLIERLTALENRVLQPGKIDQGNTSKSSSSTVEASEAKTVHKRNDQNSATAIGQDKQDPPTIQAQEGASSADGFVRLVTAKQEIVRQRKKTRKKWLGLFRLSC